MENYIVEQGDCISSIAYEYGFFPGTLWNLAENAELKQKRKDPNVLFQGDEVFIPDKREKNENGATEQRHKFKRKGVPAKFNLRLLSNGEPRQNESYTLEIDGGAPINGTTDGDGRIEQSIPPDAKDACLFLSSGTEVYRFNLGGLDPVSTLSGVKGRLNGLGYRCGQVNDDLDESTHSALRAFQLENGLRATGDIDQQTRNKLKDLFGS